MSTTWPEYIELLSNESSVYLREEILKAVVGVPNVEEDAKFYLKMCLDGSITFGIKKIPDDLQEGPNACFTPEFKECLEKLQKRELTGKKAFVALSSALSTMNKEWTKLAINILKKDPKCNIGEATVEKIFPNLLTKKTKLCKAVSYTPKTLKKIVFPAFSQEKADGARCLLFLDENKNVTLHSSGFKTFKKLVDIENFAKKAFHINSVIDGELVFVDENENPLERKLSNGLANKALLGTISKEDARKARFYVWDYIKMNEYEKDRSVYRYEARFGLLVEDLMGMKQFYPELNPVINIIETREVENIEEAKEHFKEKITEGKEGTILKNKDFIWHGDRIPDQVKLKVCTTVTLKVIDWEPGEKGTKYEKVLGAAVCESSDGLLKVSVGSGFSDEDRVNFTKNFLVGKCIEVMANCVIDGEDGKSLFLPRYAGQLRLDKDKGDSLEAIEMSFAPENMFV